LSRNLTVTVQRLLFELLLSNGYCLDIELLLSNGYCLDIKLLLSNSCCLDIHQIFNYI